MALDWRCLLLAIVLGLVSSMVAAQGVGIDIGRTIGAGPGGAGGVDGGGDAQAPPVPNMTTPSIRQPRAARNVPPDARAGQFSVQELRSERIEFQDFVSQSFGRDLPIFGSELFKNVPTTFAPVDDVPVTADYVIGPGDEILIRAWGQLDLDVSATVDRTGAINIAKVGTINVAGIKYQDLQAYVKNSIARNFRNFELAVSLGQLRAIQIFVVGQARRSGSYTVSSMSTLVNAIFSAGGPSAKGSMRGIQLKRGNRVVTEFDLYDLLINGDKSKDVSLLPGDVIHIPPVGALVAITGSVNVPAIYELKKDGSLGDLISWAGGLSSTASGQKASFERINEQKARIVDEFSLDSTGMQTKLRSGDLVTVFAVSSRLDNAVSLRGNVAQPARFAWRQGMRVKDLIPSKEALISRHYWLRKNQTIGLDNAIAELLKRNQAAGVEISVPDLLRRNTQTSQQEAESTVAESMRRTQIAADVATANADSLRKLQSTPAGAAAQTTPPTSPAAALAAQAQTNLNSIASAALGAGQGNQAAQRDQRAAPRLVDEIKRNLNEVNWDYALIERINPRDLTTALVPFNLAKAILDGDPVHNIPLQPGDVVTIFSVDDIQVPVAKQVKYVRLEGEFNNPGIFSVEPGETIRQLIARTGGLTPNAYLFGAEFTRESTRVFQQKKLEEAVNRLERELQRSSLNRSKNFASPDEAAGVSSDAVAQQTLINRLRQVRATGRIVLEIPNDEMARIKDLPDIALEDSDRLVVPSRPSTVNVVGAVYNENAFIFSQQKRLADYLQQAGGVSQFGDRRDVYLLRADGTVLSKRQSGFFGSFDSVGLMPGDTIVVPEEIDRVSFTKQLMNYGQILYQFGLGAAALKVLRQ